MNIAELYFRAYWRLYKTSSQSMSTASEDVPHILKTSKRIPEHRKKSAAKLTGKEQKSARLNIGGDVVTSMKTGWRANRWTDNQRRILSMADLHAGSRAR